MTLPIVPMSGLPCAATGATAIPAKMFNIVTLRRRMSRPETERLVAPWGSSVQFCIKFMTTAIPSSGAAQVKPGIWLRNQVTCRLA